LQFYGRIYKPRTRALKRRIDEIVQLNGLEPYLNRLAAQLSALEAASCSRLRHVARAQASFLDEPTGRY